MYSIYPIKRSCKSLQICLISFSLLLTSVCIRTSPIASNISSESSKSSWLSPKIPAKKRYRPNALKHLNLYVMLPELYQFTCNLVKWEGNTIVSLL